MNNSVLCPHCGQLHPADARFCPVTGKEIPESRPEAAPAATGKMVGPACPHCHQPVQAEWKSCPHCGRAIPQPFDCPQCGQTAQPGWKACPNCGQRLDKRSLRQARAAAALSPEEAAQAAALEHKRRQRLLLAGIPAFLLLGVFGLSVWLLTAGKHSGMARWVVANAPAPVARLIATPTPSPTLTLTATPTRTPTFTPTIGPTPTFTPTLRAGATRVSESDGMAQVYVPAGQFLMGSADSDSLAQSEEKPQFKVVLNAFWIDRTEVTNGMYKLCVAAGACQEPGSYSSNTHIRYYNEAEFDAYPVIYVDWTSAKAYCEWAGRRLPTEAEWEKAARGTDGRIYPWGNALPDSAVLNFDSQVGDVTRVGSYPSGASPYGALDMAGNVWEWVADWYQPDYYTRAPSDNPPGPSSGESRVLRGGSWNSCVSCVRAADRGRRTPSLRDDYIGFRCARSP